MDTNIDASTDIGASTDIDADRRQLPLDENSRRHRQMPPHIMAQLEERIQALTELETDMSTRREE